MGLCFTPEDLPVIFIADYCQPILTTGKAVSHFYPKEPLTLPHVERLQF
jgi:hypothetical protein